MPSEALLHLPPPQPKQVEFCRAKTRYVGYGGARGGGKSWAVRFKASVMALHYGGIRIGIFRRTYPELKANHIDPLVKLLAGVAEYRITDKEFRFANGSRILMLYADTERDMKRFQGVEFDTLLIDEATQISEEWFREMSACVRGINLFPKRIYITCNPGGIGHAWVKRLFVTRSYQGAERAEDYTFIQATVNDNKILLRHSPEYSAKLDALPPKLRKAWRDGSWDIFEGQFFEEFVNDPENYKARKWTHVIEPFEVPRSWPVYRSFDWGYSKPFSCAWWTLDYDGRAYQILEYYGCSGEPNEGLKLPAAEVFGQIARIEHEHRWLKGKNIMGVADPAIWASDGGPAIIEAADRNGIYFDKADNSRIAGWMQVHYRFAFDAEGKPGLQIFNTCRHSIRTIPLMQYDARIPEDLDTKLEDHYPDALRYFCMMRPIEPVRSAPKKPVLIDPLNEELGKRYRKYDFL